jgi:hypothetical protein
VRKGAPGATLLSDVEVNRFLKSQVSRRTRDAAVLALAAWLPDPTGADAPPVGKLRLRLGGEGFAHNATI